MSKTKPICTKPPGVPAPSFCGKAPDGIDCDICAWAGIHKERRLDYAEETGQTKGEV